MTDRPMPLGSSRLQVLQYERQRRRFRELLQFLPVILVLIAMAVISLFESSSSTPSAFTHEISDLAEGQNLVHGSVHSGQTLPGLDTPWASLQRVFDGLQHHDDLHCWTERDFDFRWRLRCAIGNFIVFDANPGD